jgi:SAM-dependent methyltransferase
MFMQKKSARPYYHEFAWAYDLLQVESVPARVDFIETILAQNGIAVGSSVLDAGCGTGRYAAEFAMRGFKTYGIDSSPELITVAKSRDNGCGDVAEFMVADLLTVSFQQTFDFVLCRGVLNDFVADASRRSIFQQFAGWLRSGGILLFDVREWTTSVARYTQNPLHRRTVELPNGRLRFESETRLDHESRRMLIHERFEIDEGGVSSVTENEFIMRPWTAGEIADYLHVNRLQELGSSTSYGECGQTWSDRLVITARKAGIAASPKEL